MKRWIFHVALVMAALAVAACVERKSETTLNPDGSGKIVIDQVMLPPPQMAGGAAVPDAQDRANAEVMQFFMGAAGVEAWKDVSFKAEDGGRISLKATGYFPDISRLQIQPSRKIKWTKDERGGGTLMFEDPAVATEKPPELTDEQVKEMVKDARARYQQNAATAELFFKGLRLEMAYKLPGKIKDAGVFTKTGESSALLVIDGKKMIESMDRAMKDDRFMEATIREGKRADDKMAQILFGRPGPVKLTVSDAGKPQFEYKKEMEEARAGQEAMFKKIGIDMSNSPVIRHIAPGGTGK